MRKCMFLVLVLIISCPVFAKDKITIVQGSVNKESISSLILFEVIEGKRVEYASTKLDGNSNYAFAIPNVKEGLYYLSDQNRREFIRIYLKPGDRLTLNILKDDFEIKKSSKENKLLNVWYRESFNVTNPAFNWMKDTSTFRSFFPNLTAFLPVIPEFKQKIKTKNKKFNELMHLIVDTEIEHAAIYFTLTPNSIHPAKEEFPEYYNQIVKPEKFSSADILKLGDGVDYLLRYTTFASLKEKNNSEKINRLQLTAGMLGNDTLKGALIANSLRFKTFEELEKNIEPVRHYLLTDSMQASYFRALKAVSSFKKGSPSFNFNYEEISGKRISMNDLKGKVVLIDVWATWCGPCKVEIPHLKKLEEELKGKNIAIVSISVDVEKDKEKWKNFVQKESLGGIQLFASGWGDITRYYDISGIPRFMVFDQEGKIVTADAPRPSNPELKTLLETIERENAVVQ